MKREFLFDIFRCSNTPEIFPLEWPKKVMFHLLANRIYRNIFLKDKQPWFQAMQIFYSLKTHWILITQHRKNPKQSGFVAGFEVCYADLYILFGWSFSHQVRFRIPPWVVCVNGKHPKGSLSPIPLGTTPFYAWEAEGVWVIWCMHDIIFNPFIHHAFFSWCMHLRDTFFLPPTLCRIWGG